MSEVEDIPPIDQARYLKGLVNNVLWHFTGFQYHPPPGSNEDNALSTSRHFDASQKRATHSLCLPPPMYEHALMLHLSMLCVVGVWVMDA